ncbi:MAG: phosphatidylglycerophosphatase A [Bacteroides sp.]|nr:phosphatidylglycerophosphatase A [Bacteroides sp.]
MKIQKIIATGFGSGLIPFAPGTMGALLATIIWGILSLLLSFNLLWWITIALIVVFTFAGIWATNALEKIWGEDPSRVVVDEMVGVWIALLGVAEGNLYQIVIAFVLFRLFDIFKPFGIRKMESLKGGLGVMMDDILAGIYSLILLVCIRWAIG